MDNQTFIREDQMQSSSDFLLDVLGDDLGAVRKMGNETGSQTWRRVYCSTLFTYVDAIMRKLHRDTIVLKREEGCGPPEDKQYTLAQMREIDCGPLKPQEKPFLENLAYGIREYASMNHADFEVDRSLPGWAALVHSLSVRDRLCNPGTVNDVTISARDWENLLWANFRFRKTVRDMLSACLDGGLKFLQIFEQHLEQASSSESSVT